MNVSSLPSGWSIVELATLQAPGDYSFVGGPFGSNLTQSDYVSDPGVPVIRGTNLGGSESRFVDDGFVYVSDDKANALRSNMAFPGDLVFTQRGTLGQVAVIPTDARFQRYVISQSQMKLTPDVTRVDRQFLYHFFRTPRAIQSLLLQTQATGVPHINLGILRRAPTLLPPIDQQRRIAEVLDRAEALRAKRRAALALLDTLAQSIFVDLFGDPLTNPKAWPTRAIREIGTVVTGNTPSRARSEYYGSEIEWVKSDNLNTPLSTVTSAVEWLSIAGKEVARTAPAGSVLVTCIAGSPDCIGNAAITNREVAFNQQINALIPANDDVLFLYMQLVVGKRLVQNASTAGMKGLVSKSRFEAIRLIVPPLDLQKEFARRIAAVEALKAAHRASLAQLDALFASLQHRAFRGEL